jgi:hypothetical protein
LELDNGSNAELDRRNKYKTIPHEDVAHLKSPPTMRHSHPTTTRFDNRKPKTAHRQQPHHFFSIIFLTDTVPSHSIIYYSTHTKNTLLNVSFPREVPNN